MEAEIKIGEVNICVDCGQVQVTYALDEDGLPLCEICAHIHNGTWEDLDLGDPLVDIVQSLLDVEKVRQEKGK